MFSPAVVTSIEYVSLSPIGQIARFVSGKFFGPYRSASPRRVLESFGSSALSLAQLPIGFASIGIVPPISMQRPSLPDPLPPCALWQV